MKHYMDLTGNIKEKKQPTVNVVHKQIGRAVAYKDMTADPFEDHMTSIENDDSSDDVACVADNFFECPNFYLDESNDIDDVVVCRVCGRMDWKKKESLGAKRFTK